MADALTATQSAGGASTGTTPFARRMVAVVVALACGGVLGLAAFLTPSEEGIGTHQQLNLPACGWISLMDLPCVTCGMTTSFSHAARGDLLQALLTQPFGGLLAVATAMTFLIALHVSMTGSNLGMLFSRLWGRSTMWLLGGLLLASWIYKIVQHKGLL